ncbi:MAG TPA: GNAT family N-acetyltransferase [Herpetosiphonaceae bacterium]|nr:GNAT family N-acetyltransferase [Herpetosiphonaceae bacterium]
MSVSIKILGPGDGTVLENVADVFDNPVDPRWAAEFLADERHHLAVAISAGQVVGMASAVHYVHPDKPPELWINEVGVDEAHRNQGLGRRLLAALFERGRALGCGQAWVLTDESNAAARRLYAAAGGEETREIVMVSFDLGDA